MEPLKIHKKRATNFVSHMEIALTCTIDLSEYMSSIVRCILAMLSCRSNESRKYKDFMQLIFCITKICISIGKHISQ